jgi:hypothetical protein
VSLKLRVIAKIDATRFQQVSQLPALEKAELAITYDIDMGNGAVATAESEAGVIEFLECLRKDAASDRRVK